ncbi:MFS transporter, AAHS family, benzoate transport protein [Raineyella antarctica]|uniref:MFS transporter, AAHS family, benzoate transport protein n=1 Tax=Raineyella antarctica TaxID=1577474 RepID=A0A1G6HCI7_9ACTN|nr:MFS transporter [Raineyella antarctica]SDB91156.1 MFS transporter, AAHS family, benzoate transport protein [Raineyella antarctica]
MNTTTRSSASTIPDIPADHAKEARTAGWVAAIAGLSLLFDGFDLTVYGTVLPGLRTGGSNALGWWSSGITGGQAMNPAVAGELGSYALIGVMIGALAAGAIGDRIGRKKLILGGIAWFSLGMFITAFAESVTVFGAMRLITGLGLGVLLATAGATMAEFAPAGKRNFYNAIVYSGIPAGGVLAAFLGLALLGQIGWRGMFMIGATPILFLFPLALVMLPESPRWLLSRGQVDRAVAISRKTGIPLREHQQFGGVPVAEDLHLEIKEKVGFAGIFSKKYLVGTLFLGLMSFSGLLLTFGLNTWLPSIMGGHFQDAGMGADAAKRYGLIFLLLLNGGAVVGGLIASRVADKAGPQRVIITTFTLAALSLTLMTFGFPIPMLLAYIAVAGVGVLGTQVLIYGFTSNYYATNVRAAGVAWCSGFGRLGGILGPLIGGWLAAAGLGGNTAFYVFAGVALFGGLMTTMVPRPKAGRSDAQQLAEEELAVANA